MIAMRLLADGIQSLSSTPKLYAKRTLRYLAEVGYQHSPLISAPLTMPMVLSWTLIAS